MSLATDLQALLTLQGVDTRLDRARAALAALDTGAATAAAYNTGKAEFDTLKTAALKAQAAQHDAEMRLATIETKIAQSQKAMYGNAAINARELQNLQKEADMLAHQKADAEEKVLVAMEAASEASTRAQTREGELTLLADGYRKIRAAHKERSAVMVKEIAAIEAERADAARPVPAALLSRYETLRGKKQGVGAAPLLPNDDCGACHTHLNSTLTGAIREARDIQVCEYCARILVPPAVAA